MMIVFIRTIILYFLIVVVLRLMGKRQIVELEPFELVITIMISDLACQPMQDNRLPLLLGIIPIITLLLLKNILSLLQLKSAFLRRVIDGEPTIIISKGKIIYTALKKQQITIEELIEELRLLDYYDLENIQYAILENNGNISVIPYDSNKSLVNPKFPKLLISDGRLNKNILNFITKDKILSLLKENNINSIKNVMIAMLDTNGNFRYQLFTKSDRR
ncbi:MAG: DUF421 domain-containing protein [Clostridium sp.]|nr:DUF421 domain-containing protein [Clostridium sp.]